MLNQRRNNLLLIVSFLLPLSCLFSGKKKEKKRISQLLLKVPGCVQVLLMFLEY